MAAIDAPRYDAAVGDLEERALRRDKGFLVKLAAGLLVGVVFGLFVWGKLTSSSFAGCVSGAMVEDGATPAE